MTIAEAHKKGKWVGMCGELAGMQKAIPIFLGMELDEFSMTSHAIPTAKILIGKLTDAEAKEIAISALNLATSSEVEANMATALSKLG
jgi:phosphotransferase system enzyme I (PtsI)